MLINPAPLFSKPKKIANLQGLIVDELYCHSSILCRKTKDVANFDWLDCDVDQLVENTRYPVQKT